ncbi:MAG TPA: helix-turn-helix transcriptional regulator [Candidatus Limnocylindria bacterium]|nr:helix-turn-helix transcriptional regulator [Candidatus Limnocylindria bacterium]
MRTVKRRRIVVDDSALALRIGQRIRAARTEAGLTQQQLAHGRYTKAYISALEKGHAKPSMAALNFLSERLGLAAAHFLGGEEARWSRLEADIMLASGRWQEALDAYSELLALAGDRASRAELLRNTAEALCRLGRGLEAIGPATEAADILRQLHRERDAVLASYWLANALYLSENSAEARSLLRSLIDRLRGGLAVEPDLHMRLLTAMASVETWDGEHEAAVTYLEEAGALSGDLDDRRRAAFLSTLALAYQGSGDIEGAIRVGTESLSLYRSAQAEREVALLHNHLANAYSVLGNLERATEFAAQARQGLSRLGDAHELAHVIDTEARIDLARGDAEAAIRGARRAIAAARAVGNDRALADALVTMARAASAAGEPELAIDSYEKAAAQLRRHGSRAQLQSVLGEWAELLARQGQHERAYELTREALRGSNATAPA